MPNPSSSSPDLPALHAHTHRPKALGGTDPIEITGSTPKLYPAPGSIVAPGSEGKSFGAQLVTPIVEFPGGVIVAAAQALESPSGFPLGGAGYKETGASRNPSYAEQNATSYADADACWEFSPVDDLGCVPGMLYGVFFQWHIRSYTPGDGSQEPLTGTPHLEAQSDHTDDAHLWINDDGHRFNNASSGPFRLLDPSELEVRDYWSMSPFGGIDYYGDFPMQGNNAGQAVSFRAGERLTIKAWIDGTTFGKNEWIGIDHFVFVPRAPFEDGETEEFQSVALEVWGYYEDPQPADVTEETDLGGAILGSDVTQDVQEIDWAFDGHMTIASHDEADTPGLYTTTGGLHVYVLCRGVRPTNDGTFLSGRANAHVTTFAGSQPLSDALCDEGGGWCWIYAGYMPLGTSMTGAVGVMCWLNTSVKFPQLNGNMNAVRISFICYVPGMAENLPAVRTDLST